MEFIAYLAVQSMLYNYNNFYNYRLSNKRNLPVYSIACTLCMYYACMIMIMIMIMHNSIHIYTWLAL